MECREYIRNWDTNTLEVSVAPKIVEMAQKWGMNECRPKLVTIPQSGYIVNPIDIESQLGSEAYQLLDEKGIKQYMQMVGSFIWIAGVRMDIALAVTYLSWFNKEPRVHHMTMAYHLLAYLYHSREVPLVLGGKGPLKIEAYCDSSYATGPRCRSVTGIIVRLGDTAGTIIAKAKACAVSVKTSSFESELDATNDTIKAVMRVNHMCTEMEFAVNGTSVLYDKHLPVVYNDNEKSVEFCNDRAGVKQAKHIDVRQWFAQEQIAMKTVELVHMKGVVMPADRLTKPCSKDQQTEFRKFVMGSGI
jgi:hypothetical protein